MELKKVNILQFAAIIFKIDNKAFSRPFDLPSRDINEQRDYLKASEVFIAYENGEPIGFIAYEIRKNETEIKSIAILPEHQGKGIGKM